MPLHFPYLQLLVFTAVRLNSQRWLDSINSVFFPQLVDVTNVKPSKLASNKQTDSKYFLITAHFQSESNGSHQVESDKEY